jgi:hypothetical protein
MADWFSQPVVARNIRRGVIEQSARIPNAPKHLARDWLIVHAHCRDAWMYEHGPRDQWVPKNWYEPPILTVVTRHRSEEDARRHMAKSYYGTRSHDSRRYFIVHKDVFERMKPLWR